MTSPVAQAMEAAPPRAAPAISTRGLEKRYGEHLPVDGLTLDVFPGEVFGLLGPNGAGKTTTILMLLGMTEPTGGSAQVLGLDPARRPLEVKRRVGYLPDNVGFYGAMTGRQNLLYTARLNALEDAAAHGRVDELLAAVGLADAAHQRVDTYSRGMRQRLGIADVLVKDPEVVILDEPTIAIDPEGVEEILALIRSLARDRGAAVLLSSHLLHQVESVCDRVGIFVAGRMVAHGHPAALGEELSAGGVQLEVTADGPPTAIEGALRGLEAVIDVRGDLRGRGRWLVRASEDVRDVIARELVGAGVRLLELRRRDQALDAVYQRWFEQAETAAGPPAEPSSDAPGAAPGAPPAAPERAAIPAAPAEGGDAAPEPAARRAPRAGWTVVAAKELGDHLLSARFSVLLLLLSLVAAGSVYAAAGGIREVAPDASGTPGLFLRLFTAAPERIPPFFAMVGFLAPLLGIAFGFDAVNGERAQSTLPRLLSQPIHRDDVVNGKFAAGLVVIAAMLGALTLLVAGLGLLRLGIVPTGGEVGRMLMWLAITILYVGFWLGLAALSSVTFRRAATSALVVIAVWLVVALFGGLLAGLAADAFAPAGAGAPFDEQLRNARLQQSLARLSPGTLYEEATIVLLDPGVRTVGLLLPQQLDRAVASQLTLDQSLLLVWPQTVGLVAVTVVCFAAAYLLFMRQEVRA